jgi:CBS domain containing-hemolysin-like protein
VLLFYLRGQGAVRFVTLRAVRTPGALRRREGQADVNEGWLTALKLLAVLALVFGNGFFVASEFALVTIRRSRVDEMVAKGVTGAKAVQRATRRLDHYIAASQLGVTLMSLALGWLGEPTLGHLLERGIGRAPAGPTLAVIIAFTIITSLHIVLGELTPKSIALQHTDRAALILTQPLSVFALIFRPFIVALSNTGRAVVGLLGLRAPFGHELVHSADELKMLVEASGRAGALEESEREIINRAFDFADFAAHEVMVPRTEVAAVAAETPGDDLLAIVEEAGFSRYPVYDGSLDHVIGVMHVKDLLGAMRRGELAAVRARDLAREPMLVPDTLGVDDLLDRMRAANARMVIVIDEFGGTAGVVTMENLVERLVGSLRDEFERRDEPGIERRPDGSAVISGLMLIGDANEIFGLKLDDTEFDTIGGYIFGHLGRLPEPGDVVEVDGHRLQVESMDGRRVDRVVLIPCSQGEQPDAASAL